MEKFSDNEKSVKLFSFFLQSIRTEILQLSAHVLVKDNRSGTLHRLSVSWAYNNNIKLCHYSLTVTLW